MAMFGFSDADWTESIKRSRLRQRRGIIPAGNFVRTLRVR